MNFLDEEVYHMEDPKDSYEMGKNLANIYSGKLIIKEIALFSNSFSTKIIWPLLLAFIRLFIPFFVRLYTFGNIFHNFKWDDILYSVLEVIFSWILISLNFLFVFSGVIDFQRRRT